MSTIVFVLAGVLACAMVLVVGWRYYRRRTRSVSVKRLSFIQPFPHKLTAEKSARPSSITYIIVSRWRALR